jgi:hypothetical protein
MPKKKKRVLDVELDISLQITTKKRCEVGLDGHNSPDFTFPEIHDLLNAAAKAPLCTKGTAVIKFAYGEAEVEVS